MTSQTTMDGFTFNKWTPKDMRQTRAVKAITEAVIMCNMPLSVVENPAFRNAIQTLQPSFSHITRFVMLCHRLTFFLLIVLIQKRWGWTTC